MRLTDQDYLKRQKRAAQAVTPKPPPAKIDAARKAHEVLEAAAAAAAAHAAIKPKPKPTSKYVVHTAPPARLPALAETLKALDELQESHTQDLLRVNLIEDLDTLAKELSDLEAKFSRKEKELIYKIQCMSEDTDRVN
jgi:hypothetical protein